MRITIICAAFVTLLAALVFASPGAEARTGSDAGGVIQLDSAEQGLEAVEQDVKVAAKSKKKKKKKKYKKKKKKKKFKKKKRRKSKKRKKRSRSYRVRPYLYFEYYPPVYGYYYGAPRAYSPSCARAHEACTNAWGYNYNDYRGCMRYYGCM